MHENGDVGAVAWDSNGTIALRPKIVALKLEIFWGCLLSLHVSYSLLYSIYKCQTIFQRVHEIKTKVLSAAILLHTDTSIQYIVQYVVVVRYRYSTLPC